MAAFSRYTDRFTCWDWGHYARCAVQDNERQDTK